MFFEENGNFESHTELPFYVVGNWFIDENGANLTLEHEKEKHETGDKPVERKMTYRIDQFSKNYITLTDPDNLTFVFKKS